MASWAYFNPNPNGYTTGDCVIRAICAVTGDSWQKTYTGLALQGYVLGDLMNANHVWRAYLKSLGYDMHIIPNTCPDCYTVDDFANDRPHGNYVLATGTHAVAVVDGIVMDSWDSRGEVPIFYFVKEE